MAANNVSKMLAGNSVPGDLSLRLPAAPHGGSRRERWTVAIIVIAHCCAILLSLYFFSGALSKDYSPVMVADGYDYLATQIVAGHGYRFYPDTALTTMREPGYPFILAALLSITGKIIEPAIALNVMLALCAAFVLWRIAVTIVGHTALALLAPALYLFHPGTLVAESRGGVEILFGFLLLLFMQRLLRAISEPATRHWVLCGAVLGCTVLIRSTPLLFPVFVGAYLVCFERRRFPVWTALRSVAVMGATMAIVMAPWVIRNYNLTGKFLPTASVLGVSEQTGQFIFTHRFEDEPWWQIDREAGHERSRLATQLGYRFEDGVNGYYQTFYKTSDELAFSSYLAHKTSDFYRAHPSVFVQMVAANLFNFWFTGKNHGVTLANIAVQFPFLLLAGAGLWMGRHHAARRILMPMVLLIVYMMAISAPILAQARYSVPLIPYLALMATVLLAAVARAGNMADQPEIASDVVGIRKESMPILQGSVNR